ncbi:glycosyltransferase family 4 protein [Candidatus Peregrinibacteria bacterium]|nr:glycosyltransferase family 4 protein [Candidatus Peregrinibacteria bacterium]
MKIGINARFLPQPYTGIGKYSYNLLSALAQLDEKNEYFLFTPQLVDFPLPDNFKQIRVPEKDYRSPSLRKAHWEHTLIPKEIKKWSIDLAHFLYPSNPLIKLGIPTIVTVHDMIPWRLPQYNKHLRSKLYHMYAKWALKRADHIITVSDFSKSEIQQIIKTEDKNLSVTHLAPPITHYDEMPPGLHLRRKFLLYVGGYDSRKNVPMLMIAYQKFIANYNPIDLILVGAKGKGLEEFITDEFTQKVAGQFPVKPKGRVIFTEALQDSELCALYKQTTALVHPSIYEGFNLPLVEAMKHGRPLVISDIPVNREVAGDAGFYVDPSSENTFGIGLHEFLHNADIQKKLAESANVRRKDFNWQQTAQQTLDVYNLFM